MLLGVVNYSDVDLCILPPSNDDDNNKMKKWFVKIANSHTMLTPLSVGWLKLLERRVYLQYQLQDL